MAIDNKTIEGKPGPMFQFEGEMIFSIDWHWINITACGNSLKDIVATLVRK